MTETEQEWHRQSLALQRQWREEEVSRYREWRARTEKNLRAKFAAQQAAQAQKTPPPLATRGTGWRVLEAPRVSHAVLAERARAIWKFCWHSADWPARLRIRWGQLDDTLLGLLSVAEACTARQRGRVLGLYVAKERIILLDEANHRGRPARDIVETIVHELCHVQVRTTVHGEQFQQALKSAMSFYDGAPTAPAFMTSASAPSPWAGMRFRPGGLFDPTLEYRG